MDKSGRCDILHFASYLSKRVTRSVLGGKLLALADAFDSSVLHRETLGRLLGFKPMILLVTDSMSVFDVLCRGSEPTETRLLVDAEAMLQAYNSGDIHSIVHVDSAENPADALTKLTNNVILSSIQESGKCGVVMNQWICRWQFRP